MSVKNFLGSPSNNLRGIAGCGAAIVPPNSFYLMEFTCKDCGHKQQTMCPRPSIFMPFSLEDFVLHFWWKNFKKCPKCGKKNWKVKIIGEKHPWDYPPGQELL